MNRREQPLVTVANVRLTRAEALALKKAATDDDRTRLGLVHKIVTDWLKDKGYLK